MRAELQHVIANYPGAKRERKAGHEMDRYMRQLLPAATAAQCAIDTERYKVHGTAGLGANWADVPWVGVLDRVITTTARKGYYVTYLFATDMSKVVLSLQQGRESYPGSGDDTNAVIVSVSAGLAQAVGMAPR